MSEETKNTTLSPEEMNREMQIQMLREKLVISEKQLEDKDIQIEHYKQMVTTLKDVLADLTNRTKPAGVAPPQPTTSVIPLGRSTSSTNPPPGFEQNNNVDRPTLTRSLSTGRYDRNRTDQDDRPFSRGNGNGAPGAYQHPHAQQPSNQSQPARIPLTKSHTQINKKSTEPAKKERLGAVSKSVSMPSLDALDSKYPAIEDIAGQVYSLSKYQQGCRFLQKKLDEGTSQETQTIFDELEDHFVELMLDPFGNYLFSKLVEHSTTEQKGTIIKRILPDIMSAALDKFGSQSLQKMFPQLNDDQISKVIEGLRDNAALLIKHEKANYLVQFFMEHLAPQHSQWIYDGICQHMREIGTSRFGCVIIKKCLDRASPEQRNKMIEQASENVIPLVEDQYGNYVVQHILEKFPKEEISQKMIQGTKGKVVELCTQKFSSNVVEKCLVAAEGEIRVAMLSEITPPEKLTHLVNDRFGNFVVQTALDVADDDTRKAIVQTLQPLLNGPQTAYGKRLRDKIQQLGL